MVKCPVCKGEMPEENKFCSLKCAELGSDKEIELSEIQEKIFEFIKEKYGQSFQPLELKELKIDIKYTFGGI